MAIVFNGENTKNSPEAFPGVILKSFIHPIKEFHDGYDVQQHGLPDVNISIGLFTIEPHGEWPATKFDITEISYCIEGEGLFICDNEEHHVKAGYVIYIPKGEVRIIKNLTDKPLKYLCIVDPAWQPQFEHTYK